MNKGNYALSLSSRQRYDFIRAHTGIGLAAEGFNSFAAYGACSSRASGFAHAGVVACDLDFDLGVRQEAELVADFLWDGDLSFGVDPHDVAHASKCNRTSGAEAPLHFVCFVRGLKPSPTCTRSLSMANEGVAFSRCLKARG